MKSIAVVAGLLPFASAHFNLVYPAPRPGFDEDKLPNFPCGGNNDVSTNRTKFPLTGAPIQLKLGHTQTNIEVLVAVGNNPGDAFNTIIVPTFTEQGPKNFCMGSGAIQIPANANIKDGTNATIQVQTNGDPSGGLYQCADVTFVSTPLSSQEYNANCVNATGVQVRPLQGGAKNANETGGSGGGSGSGGDDDGDGDSHNHDSMSGMSGMSGNSTSTTGQSGTSTTSSSTRASSGLATQATLASWGMAAVGIAAGVMAL